MQKTEESKIRKSQMPYKRYTCSIGDILKAKAANGDENAKRAVSKLVKEKGEKKNGKTKGHFSRGE